ncbi:MAG: hypothetical protein D3906_14445 [Candidatus Electrothrix sp. AUS1_2]|nr:hypothetical protein [Candidatus Electrothrix sp. AUS1_2]
MKLSEKDADLFSKLMWQLLCFVNAELKIYPELATPDAYEQCDTEQKMELRNALYSNPNLIDRFVRLNPQNFSEEELAIVAKWKDAVQGNFFIEHFLKKYTVFIDERRSDVYGVLGLYEGFEDMIDRSYLPLYVRTVLLPFKGQIIYDGLFEASRIFFGGGVKGDLKEQYMRAKQNNRIILTLEKTVRNEEPQKSTASSQKKDIEKNLGALARTAAKLRGGADQPVLYTPIFSLVKASVDLARIAVESPDDRKALGQAVKKMERAVGKVRTVVERIE